MSDILSEYYPWIIFLGLATVKGLVEIWGKGHCHRGGVETSQQYSMLLIIVGSLAPFLIAAELFFLRHRLPWPVCLVSAGIMLLLWGLRVIAIRDLGDFYSVHVRIAEDHRLVREGVYHILRHPIYLVGLGENLFYPLAAGAWMSALILTLVGTPIVLKRRRDEERLLEAEFGEEYQAYRQSTWF